MAKALKRQLRDSEIQLAKDLLKRGASVAMIAKSLGVNKPSVMKAIEMWNKPTSTLDNGLQFHMRRGKVFIEQEPKA
jgi:predicted transcriptional regulator